MTQAELEAERAAGEGKFVVFKSFTMMGWRWYFHAVSKNNEKVCQSQGYKQRIGAIRGISALRRIALNGEIEDQDDDD